MTIVCRNTVRESLHIFLLWRGPFLWSCAAAGEHTGGADRSAWTTNGSLPSLERPADLSPSFERPQTLYCLFKSHAEVWTSSSPHVFFCLWLVVGTYILPVFFPAFCWSYLRTEIFVTLSIGNKLYSRHHILYFSFLWRHFVDVILRPLCLSSPAKQVYYIIFIIS